MASAEFLQIEASRQAAVRDLGILQSEPEKEFDALVRAAAAICDTPICLIGLVDGDRLWLKAQKGLTGISAFPRAQAFCEHVIEENKFMIVPDATADPRFADNPLVNDAPRIRFYAGTPLRLSGGHVVGTLCIIDRQPRTLNRGQQDALQTLAEAAVHALEHRRKEKLLQGEFQRLAYVLDASNSGSWEWDIETGELRLSHHWAVVLGKSPEQIRAISFEALRDLIHPDDLDETDRSLAQHFEGELGNVHREVRMRHQRGYWVWVVVRGRVMAWTPKGKPRLMFGTVEDITERKRQEELSRRNEIFLDRTGRLAGIGGWELDLRSGQIIWSEETCRIHGVPIGYVPSSLDDAVRFYAPEARPVIQAAVKRGMAEGVSWDLELPFINAAGRRLWVRATGAVEHEDGRAVRLIGAFQDITERVLAYQELQRANERTVLATDSGQIGIWELDLADNLMIWDAWMYRLYGMAPQEGTSPYEMWAKSVHPDDLAAAEYNLVEAIAGRRPLEDVEFRIIRSDGNVRMMHGSGHVVRDESGVVQRVVGSMYDVTDARCIADDLAKEHELLQVTLRSIGDGVITTDAIGLVSWMNPAAERLTGWLTQDVENQPLGKVFNIVNELTRRPIENPIVACQSNVKFLGAADTILLLSRSGIELSIEASAAPIRHSNGRVSGFVFVFNDVSAQRRISGEMPHRASDDALLAFSN